MTVAGILICAGHHLCTLQSAICTRQSMKGSLRRKGGCRQRHPMRGLAIDLDFERVLTGLGQRHVEHQHRPGLDLGDAGGRLAELKASFAPNQLSAVLIHKTDPHRMGADLHPFAANPKHEVGAGVDRGKGLDPHVLKDPHHGELPVLIHQGVVGENREIDDHGVPERS